MAENKLTIVIINWNTRALLDKCLRSLYKNLSDISGCQIIVVDNGSVDGSGQLVREKYPGVCLIANQVNLGFACAANKGLGRARGRFILFLNTDIVLPAGGLGRLLEFMEEHPRAGLCTPALCRRDGSRQKTCVSFPSLTTELLGRFPSLSGEEPRAVSSIRGACMLTRSEVIRKLGGFNEKYFFFWEETDLCRRLRQKGYKIWFVPSVKAQHRGGQTAARDPASARIEFWKSRYIFFHEHYSWGKNAILLCGLGSKLFFDWLINLTATVVTLGLAGKFRTRLRVYSIIAWWHLRGQPGDWGLGSGNITRNKGYYIKIGWTDWWQQHHQGLQTECGAGKEVKKSNQNRVVFVYDDKVFVKLYRARFLLKKPWQKEWRLLNRISQLNIRTTNPLVCGRGLLITEKIPHVSSLHEFIINQFSRISIGGRITAIKAFAEFIKELHHKGVYHKDLHAGNILVKVTDSGYKFYITDLHRARIKMYLSRRDIINNLVQLGKFFSVTVSPATQLRFFREYVSGTHFQKRYRDYARILAGRINRACFRLWRKRDRLYFTRKKYGLRIRHRGIDLIINPLYIGVDPARVVSQMKPGHGEVIKDSRSSYLSRFYLAGAGEVVFKLYRQKKVINYIKDLFRQSRGFRAWQGSWSLITRRIPTADPVLAGQIRKWGIIRSSFIVTRYIPDTRNLTLTTRESGNQRNPELAFQLALFIRKIHNRGIFPCDLKGSNVLIAGRAGENGFYLIDTDHIIARARISLRQRLYNVRQIRRSTGLFPAAALNIRKILIVKPSSLGDIMQSLPAVLSLRQHLPDVSVWWVANTGYQDLLKMVPGLAGIIPFARRRWGQGRNILLTLKELPCFISELRRGHYDLAVDLQGLFRSGIIALLSGAPLRLGFRNARDQGRIFYNYRILASFATTNAYKKYQTLINYIAPVDDWSGPGRLNITGEILARMEAIWGDRNKIRIVVNPGGRWETKRWPAGYYAELINKLSAKYNPAIILVGDRQDTGPADRVAKAVLGLVTPVINLAGQTDLVELAAIISGCRILISNDSGPMHLAAYLGKPVIALFGPTDPGRTGPLGNNNRIIEAPVACRPCFRRRCRRFICMKAIPVKEVLSAVEDVVKKS